MSTNLPILTENSEAEISDGETSPLQARDRSPTSTKKSWDQFRETHVEGGSLSEKGKNTFVTVIKILKVITYLVTFGVVLIAAVITKGLVLLMTSQLTSKKRTNICRSSFLKSGLEYYTELPESENIVWAWMIWFCFVVPELGSFVRSFRMCFFKSCGRPQIGDFFFVWLFETLHTVGTAILMYTVLPELDVVKGAMLTNCVAFMPGLYGLLSRTNKESHLALKVALDIMALACQLTGFFVWPIIDYDKDAQRQVWITPLAIFLISFGWWENFVDSESRVSFVKYLAGIKQRLEKTRNFSYIFISAWKILAFFIMMIVCMEFRLNTNLFYLRGAFNSHNITIYEAQKSLLSGSIPNSSVVAPITMSYISSNQWTPTYVFLVQIFTAWLTYTFGKFACKIGMQGFSFALPVCLTIPLTVSLLISGCGLKFVNVCHFNFMPQYLFWECKNMNIMEDLFHSEHAWMWLFWIISQIWITWHIWTPKCDLLASTEKLFATPLYNSLLIDQSLAFNRRNDRECKLKNEEEVDERRAELAQMYDRVSIQTDSSHADSTRAKSPDEIPRIYGTATMWHETEGEMLEFLKSIFRMDEDQSSHRIAQKYLKVVSRDYYEWETHVFFDDAFEIADDDEDENVVNKYVKDMVRLMEKAAKHVHKTDVRVRSPSKYPTPYGGRLVWTLPGKTKIVAHLKDKSKIRHKKRWSQVMYMYYLLGFKLIDQPISTARKEKIAQNTFILALDGDVDFEPSAVQLLVDLMKNNQNLGAACGRIHPVGGGLMVWYQMFEYAVGHWLQKATEHTIGCVLCSPGCFSLFRGKALMDDNVMKKYTTMSSQARHHVQYDQGEDRWLCTLLLQRGYRVEYSAASDAYTHAPEGFSEFYNQRRRWMPSTMANIMDLLMDYERTVKINDNISLPYILYQLMLMVGTILGPGTIFLMLVGAFVSAFEISNADAFQANIYPIVVYMIICFFLDSKLQIKAAYILSAVYALVMIAVIVGLFIQFNKEGYDSPTSIFLLATAASFVITGFLHPKELMCLVCGIIYYLLIPSMYLLLAIYSCFNLNNVSWGTREVAPKVAKKTREDVDAAKKAEEEAKKKKKKNGLLDFLHTANPKNEDEGSFEFSCAGLFKMMCCTHPKPNMEQQFPTIGKSLDRIINRIENMEKHMGITTSTRRRSSLQPRNSIQLGGRKAVVFDGAQNSHGPDNVLGSVQEGNNEPPESSDSEKTVASEDIRDNLVNPYWMEDKTLPRGRVDYMPDEEVQFFKDLIEIYLSPIAKDKDKEAKAAQDLKDLRNKVVFTFTMLNAFFVWIIFLFQLQQDTLYLSWPLGVRSNFSYVEDTNEVHVFNKHLKLEPIGVVFLGFFGVIMIIQFIAMLFHRLSTFSHILARTELFPKAREVSEDSLPEEEVVDVVKLLQKLKNSDQDKERVSVGRRMTIHNLAQHAAKNEPLESLDAAFRKRFFSISEEGAENNDALKNLRRLSVRRDTIHALQQRRDTIIQQRRRSRLETPTPQRSLSFAQDVETM